MSLFQGAVVVIAGSLTWLTGTLDGTEPSLTKFVSCGPLLVRQRKMSAVIRSVLM